MAFSLHLIIIVAKKIIECIDLKSFVLVALLQYVIIIEEMVYSFSENRFFHEGQQIDVWIYPYPT